MSSSISSAFNSSMRSLNNALNSMQRSLNSMTTQAMKTLSNIGSGLSNLGQSALQETKIWGSALGIGMSYGLGQMGSGIGNFGSSLAGTLGSPFAQTSISAINRGFSTYFGQWANTLKEWAPGWTQGLGKAIGFQSAFQGLGLLQGSFGYVDIMNKVATGSISQWQGYTAIGINTVGMGVKAAGTHFGRLAGIAYLGSQTFGIGATWGGVAGAVIGGTVTSIIVDPLERFAYKYLGIE